jgi:hypothetical protein
VNTVPLPIELTAHDFGSALLRSRTPEFEEIARRIRDGRAVAVVGEHGVGKTRLVGAASAGLWAEAGIRVARLDLRACTSETRLAWNWMRALAGAVAGPVGTSHIAALPQSMWPGTTRAAAVGIRRLLRERTDWAAAPSPGRLSEAEAREALIAAARATVRCAQDAETVVVVDHVEAPMAAPRETVDLDGLLWNLRGASQETDALHVALVSHPADLDRVAGPRAAYAGAPVITVSRPAADTWRDAVADSGQLLGVVGDVLQYTAGHIPSTVLLLHVLAAAPGTTAGSAFDALAVTQVEHARRCVQHAATLHRLGAQLLETVARRAAPYGENSDARPRDLSKALRALWRGGLLTHPGRGRWEVADPLVAHIIRGDANASPASGARA